MAARQAVGVAIASMTDGGAYGTPWRTATVVDGSHLVAEITRRPWMVIASRRPPHSAFTTARMSAVDDQRIVGDAGRLHVGGIGERDPQTGADEVGQARGLPRPPGARCSAFRPAGGRQ